MMMIMTMLNNDDGDDDDDDNDDADIKHNDADNVYIITTLTFPFFLPIFHCPL